MINYINDVLYMHVIEDCVYMYFYRHKGSNSGKRARRKNLRHPRERFLVSNEAPPSWRPIEIIPARCLILVLTNFYLTAMHFQQTM